MRMKEDSRNTRNEYRKTTWSTLKEALTSESFKPIHTRTCHPPSSQLPSIRTRIRIVLAIVLLLIALRLDVSRSMMLRHRPVNVHPLIFLILILVILFKVRWNPVASGVPVLLVFLFLLVVFPMVAATLNGMSEVSWRSGD
ncbi:hypothetical protein BDV98DRAFT_360986 [Pterulicium gracile]|uniref:Uncharacterized protein n=1 Tax=Pterulicium gracile TaxID=1884261 RepID=A0A5C3QQ60_9AGAR|nr:hypothetical protein BDV98DRAFT_360986 [Pterula gracilis]